MKARLLFAVFGGGLVACGEDPSSPAPVPGAISPVTAASVSAVAGSPVPITVRITSAAGTAVPGATVVFAVTGGGGTLSATSVQTGIDGRASITWTLGVRAGTNTMAATVASLPPLAFTVLGTAGPATALVVASGAAQTATAGHPVATAPAVRVTDVNDNPVAGFLVTFAVTSGGGSIGAGNVTTDQDGIATPGVWTLGKEAGPNSLTVTATGLSGPPVTFQATGLPGAPAAVTISSGDKQTVRVGLAVAVAPAVGVRDEFGNPVSNIPVTFTVGSGGGSLGSGSVTTNEQGIAAAGAWTLGRVAGRNTLLASVTGLTADPITFEAIGIPGPPARITVSAGDNQTARVGLAVPVAPAIVLHDDFANVASGVTVTFAVTSGGGTIAAGSSVTDTNGVATAGQWMLGPVPGEHTVRAVVASLAPAVFRATGVAFTAIAAGGESACGLVYGGEAYCWGMNAGGTLGNGDINRLDRLTPALVLGEHVFTSITAGEAHYCALTSSGSPWCWGSNFWSQIGDGTPPFSSGLNGGDRLVPTAVSGGLTFTSLAAGGLHTCGLTPAGKAWCWGGNTSGQLGNGSVSNSATTPVPVLGGLTFVRLSVGLSQSCGLTSTGRMYCWGAGSSGQLGGGDQLGSAIPQEVPLGNRFVTLAAGDNHTCGLDETGRAWCWGSNTNGQLGDGSTTKRFAPVLVAGGHQFVAISAGSDYSHTCGLKADGTLYCWGINTNGGLGDGSTSDRLLPTRVTGGHKFTQVSAGGGATCGIISNTALYCWGNNAHGQLGDGSKVSRPSATPVRFP